MQTYSFANGGAQIGVNTTRLYKWYQRGALQPLMDDPSRKRLSDRDLDRIEGRMRPPANSQKVIHILKLMTINNDTFLKMVHQKNIKPAYQHRVDQVGPRCNYYYNYDLKKLGQMLFQKRQTNSPLHHFTINTDHIYDPKIDANQNELCRQLGIPENNNSIIPQWINYHRIDHLYSIDRFGKLFFTPHQVTMIKERFKTIPKNMAFDHTQLAKHLGIHVQTLIDFRNYYHILPQKVLGLHQKFYSKEQADQIIDWYQNPKHRPYPYHPNKTKLKGGH